MSDAIPVNVITGFLGSGKTTLLRRILADPGFADCAVLINEFGEIGIDHHLVERIDGETVLMQSGCVCCTIRGDFAEAIRGLYERREDERLPPFRRLVIETTGLADPTPILATVMNDPVIRHHFRLGNVVATVDAVNGEGHLDRQPESLKQVALADRLLITKVDLAEKGAVARLQARLARINPAAPRMYSINAAVTPAFVIGEDVFASASKMEEVRRWLADESCDDPDGHDHDDADHHHGHGSRHADSIAAFTLVFEEAVDWTVFGLWLTLLLDAHGDDVLRVKGILNLGEHASPVVVNGAQHLVHAPLHLERWPDEDHRSRLVFIVRDITREAIVNSFAVFHDALAVDTLAA